MLADVELSGGGVVQVRIVEGADGLGSAGLGERLHLDDALAQIGALATLVRDSLDVVKPTKATVQFGVSFSIAGGKPTSLIVDAKGEASLTAAPVAPRKRSRPARRCWQIKDVCSAASTRRR
jgi:hypothetical protein